MKFTLDEHQTEQLRQFFQEVDKDQNGQIERQELRELLEKVWGKESEIDLTAAVQSVFEKCDLNQDGLITFEELLSLADELKW